MSEPQPKDYEISTGKPSRWAGFRSWLASVTTNSLLLLLVGGYLTYQYGLNTQIQLTNKQKRQQAYSELRGERAILPLLLFYNIEASIHSYYHERRWQLEEKHIPSTHFEESKRWMQKSEDFALEYAKSKKGLAETLGLISSYFPFSPRLKELTNRAFFLKIPPRDRDAFQLNFEQLEEWREKVKKEVLKFIETEFPKPIDELLTYLETEIDKEAH